MWQNSYSKEIIKEYTQNIPGRIRIKIEQLKNNNELCLRLMECLSRFGGITMVSANPYTSRVLIIYDFEKITIKEIEDKIRGLFCGAGSLKTGCSKIIKADFKYKRVLPPSEFIRARNVLSNEYYDYNHRSVKLLAGNEPKSEKPCHMLSVKETRFHLNTDTENGLTYEKVEQRLRQYGTNQLNRSDKKSLISMFLKQFDGFIVKLLLAASGVSLLLGQLADTITILAIIGVEAALGVWQEFKAEKSLDSLKQLSAPAARVLRRGKETEITASHVVPGDILCLEAGDIVPADARLFETQNLEVVEASLTGEPYPVVKSPECIRGENIPLADRVNMVYAGASVVKGKGKAIVVGTGMKTEMGRIAGMLNNAEQSRTPLQKDMDRLARVISWSCIGICGAISIAGILGGHTMIEMLTTGVSLAVGAIPEGMTTVLAISLAFGAQRMAKKNAIVKSLPSVETLSCTRVICTDKTGTLTKNEMTVKSVYTLTKTLNVEGQGYNNQGCFELEGNRTNAGEHADVKMLLTAAALCNNSEISPEADGQYGIKGDPTEAALLIAIEKSGMKIEEFKCYKREHEKPFDSEKKKMTAVCSNEEGKYFAFSKGAIDAILGKCNRVMAGSSVEELKAEFIEGIHAANESMAEKALRVLALAYKPFESKPANMDEPDIEENMIFLGLVGMMDPPRPEVGEAIRKCHKAGIKVVMITGDHKKTAAAIARSINLLDENAVVLSGEEIDSISEEELAGAINRVQVFARTCPEQKLKIVRAFKRKGYIVAMTGDGINDAPALKEAHIGIAMGKSGTDVTKEASSIILTDDNFNTVVNAVEEGRTINRNIKKFMKYVLSGNFAEVLAIFIASVSGMPTPLIPAQILMLNLVTEGIPALSLGVDPPEKDVMAEPPRDPHKSLFDGSIMKSIVARGLSAGLATLGIFGGTLYFTGNLMKARTMSFASLISSQMIHALECSSSGTSGNRYLVPSVAISTGVMLASIYVPVLRSTFCTIPLNPADWLLILLSSAAFNRFGEFLQGRVENSLSRPVN